MPSISQPFVILRMSQPSCLNNAGVLCGAQNTDTADRKSVSPPIHPPYKLGRSSVRPSNTFPNFPPSNPSTNTETTHLSPFQPHTQLIMSTHIVPSVDFPQSTPTMRRGTLRERCGFTLWLSLTPAVPNIRAKGHLEPFIGNLPRRKRSSVVALDLPDPARVVDRNTGRVEYFA